MEGIENKKGKQQNVCKKKGVCIKSGLVGGLVWGGGEEGRGKN